MYSAKRYNLAVVNHQVELENNCRSNFAEPWRFGYVFSYVEYGHSETEYGTGKRKNRLYCMDGGWRISYFEGTKEEVTFT